MRRVRELARRSGRRRRPSRCVPGTGLRRSTARRTELDAALPFAWTRQEAEGLAARCFLHETDHCDGLLFLDRLSPLRRDIVKRRFLKMKKRR